MKTLPEYLDDVRLKVEQEASLDRFVLPDAMTVAAPKTQIRWILELVDGFKSPDQLRSGFVNWLRETFKIKSPTDGDLTSVEWCSIVSWGHRAYIIANDGIDDFWEALHQHLKAQQREWGVTWRNRPRREQWTRTRPRIRDYISRLTHGEKDPKDIALRTAGQAYIAVVRILEPDYQM